MLLAAAHPLTPDQAMSMPNEDALDASPSTLRERAAQLVGEGETDQAFALIEEGLQTHPRDEHLLVMCALLCEVRRDWVGADHALTKLVEVQGYRAPAETWSHWVRVLRCRGHLDRAWSTVNRGLQLHPHDELLQSEHDTLRAILQAGPHLPKV